ncbi:MAG: TetR/AcrR family transcriptional regulator [Aldersonia sp.]|nr:TetR/AcrR family transcriptional regulator [Aldersonia sp.]
MPKLWDATITAHRSQVRDAICDAAAALVFERGLRGVTMAQIAERAGIGRATLYKYFGDVDAIMHAWHARQIGEHLRQLEQVRDRIDGAASRLEAVLTEYATIVHRTRGHHDVALVQFLHRDEHVAAAHRHLHELVTGLLADAAGAGEARGDVAAAELATWCLRALSAAADTDSPAAVRRLVAVTMSGLTAAS